ncbi:hypothetical protein Pla52n_19360 [Stieleria varia]|uniref:Uncharacterized protein n=1 Tax=Stieleria varia TaxID=2528005 RepID=A0A5C6B4K4_9BACT|nr:hypothetical protein Pla52n_19360 [Stieleria varia]
MRRMKCEAVRARSIDYETTERGSRGAFSTRRAMPRKLAMQKTKVSPAKPSLLTKKRRPTPWRALPIASKIEARNDRARSRRMKQNAFHDAYCACVTTPTQSPRTLDFWRAIDAESKPRRCDCEEFSSQESQEIISWKLNNLGWTSCLFRALRRVDRSGLCRKRLTAPAIGSVARTWSLYRRVRLKKWLGRQTPEQALVSEGFRNDGLIVCGLTVWMSKPITTTARRGIRSQQNKRNRYTKRHREHSDTRVLQICAIRRTARHKVQLYALRSLCQEKDDPSCGFLSPMDLTNRHFCGRQESAETGVH